MHNIKPRYRHKGGIEELATELMHISGLGIDILTLDQTLGSMDLPAY